MKVEESKKIMGKKDEPNYSEIQKRMDKIVRLMFEEPKLTIKTK